MIRARRFAQAALASVMLVGAACALPPEAGSESLPATPASDNPLADALTAAATSLPAEHMAQPSLVPQTGSNPTPLPTPVLTSDETTYSTPFEGGVVLTTAKVTRYTLLGDSAETLNEYMRYFAPLDSYGNSWLALTDPVFNWGYDCGCGEAGCVTGPLTIYVTLDYTLPTWEPPPGTDATLEYQWNRFERAVINHERGHGDLATECGLWLGEAFAVLPPQASCGAVHGAVSTASQPVFAECRAAQSNYETTTNHGQTDGVVWPP